MAGTSGSALTETAAPPDGGLRQKLFGLVIRALAATGAVACGLAVPGLRGYVAAGTGAAGLFLVMVTIGPGSAQTATRWQRAFAWAWAAAALVGSLSSIEQLPDARAAGMLFTSFVLVVLVLFMALAEARRSADPPPERWSSRVQEPDLETIPAGEEQP